MLDGGSGAPPSYPQTPPQDTPIDLVERKSATPLLDSVSKVDSPIPVPQTHEVQVAASHTPRKRAAKLAESVSVPLPRAQIKGTDTWVDASKPILLDKIEGFSGCRVKRVTGLWYAYSPEGKPIQIPDPIKPAIRGVTTENVGPEDTVEFVVG